MRRRSRLIDDYLTRHDPLTSPPSAVAGRQLAAPASRRSVVRRRNVLAGATGFAVVAGVTTALIGSSLLGSDSVLSPEAAVAAVSANLHDDRILHWSMTQVQTNGPGFHLPRVGHLQFDQWVDLETNASHVVIKAPDYSSNDEDMSRLESWFDGDRTGWSLAARRGAKPGSRMTVQRHTSPTNTPVGNASPVTDLRRSLDSAAQGKATLSDGGSFQGIPVTKVTERFGRAGEVRGTITSWIVRTHQPRLLKQVADEVDGRGRFEAHVVTTTLVWKLFPRDDAEARQQVDVPTFDPAKYRVVDPWLTTPGSTP